MKITENELLRALEEAELATNTEGKPLVTCVELAQSRGVSRDATMKALRRLNQQGKLIVGRKRIKRIDGQEQWATAYGLKKTK